MPARKGNDTGKRFTKDNAAEMARRRKGKQQRKTKVKELLGLANPERLARLTDRLDELTSQFLNSKDKRTRETAWREIIKYVHPQKRVMDVNVNDLTYAELLIKRKGDLDKPGS